MTPVLMVIAQALLGVGALIGWAWVIRYAKHPWRTTPYGKHLMRFRIVVATALTLTLAFSLLPVNQTLAVALSAIVYLGFVTELLVSHWLLGRARHDKGGPPSV